MACQLRHQPTQAQVAVKKSPTKRVARFKPLRLDTPHLEQSNGVSGVRVSLNENVRVLKGDQLTAVQITSALEPHELGVRGVPSPVGHRRHKALQVTTNICRTGAVSA